MFDVGFAELFLLSLIGLLVLGPERLPAVARTLGGFVRKARLSYYNLKRTVEAELEAADAANPLKEAQKEFESVQNEVKALGDTLSKDQTAELTPTAADPKPNPETAPETAPKTAPEPPKAVTADKPPNAAAATPEIAPPNDTPDSDPEVEAEQSDPDAHRSGKSP